MKIRVEINEIKNKKLKEEKQQSQKLFPQKINKSDKPLARVIKQKRETTQITNVRNKRNERELCPIEIQVTIKNDSIPTNVITWMKSLIPRSCAKTHRKRNS